ncbi:MAG: alpha/beta hydrolase [Actinomycetota bacterium]
MSAADRWPEPPPLPPGRTVVVPERGELFVRDSGGDGPPVVLLHGWTVTGELNWFRQWEALAERGHRVLIVDQRGHGRGLRSAQRFTLEDCADDVAGLVVELGLGRAVLAGYSMGGPVATLAAHRHPGVVDGIVLIATAMEWRSRFADRASWRLRLPVTSFALRSGLVRRGFQRWVAQLGDDRLDVHASWLLGESSRATAGDVVAAGKALSRYDARKIVPALGVPGEVIVTTKDRLVQPWRQRALAEALGVEPIELAADHDASFVAGAELAELVVEAVDRLGRRIGRPRAA